MPPDVDGLHGTRVTRQKSDRFTSCHVGDQLYIILTVLSYGKVIILDMANPSQSRAPSPLNYELDNGTASLENARNSGDPGQCVEFSASMNSPAVSARTDIAIDYGLFDWRTGGIRESKFAAEAWHISTRQQSKKGVNREGGQSEWSSG